MRNEDRIFLITIFVFGIGIGIYMPRITSLIDATISANILLMGLGVIGLIVVGMDILTGK